MSEDEGTTAAARAPDGDGDGEGSLQEAVTAGTMRWAPGIGALAVVFGLAAVLGLVIFDRSLDRVSVDGLAEDGQTDRDVASGDEGDDEDDGATVTVDDEPEAPRGLGAPLHVLVAGSDDRSVLSAEEQRELSTGDVPGDRTEALALVRVDPDTDRVDVLRFPRDLLVTRCDGSRGRINAAYAIGERVGVGGATCLVETIGSLTGIPIHHVVRIDFRGFVDAVDAVGGVEIRVDEPLRDRRAGLDLPQGCVELDGADALAFVRARHLDDDFGRIDRQQQLVAATMDQVLTSETLRDPRRLGQLLMTAQRALRFDDQLTAQRMRSIAATVARLGSDELVTRTVDGEILRSEEGIAFLHADDDYAEVLFDAFAAGELESTPSSGQDLSEDTVSAEADDTAEGASPASASDDPTGDAVATAGSRETDGGTGTRSVQGPVEPGC